MIIAPVVGFGSGIDGFRHALASQTTNDCTDGSTGDGANRTRDRADRCAGSRTTGGCTEASADGMRTRSTGNQVGVAGLVVLITYFIFIVRIFHG